MPISNPEAVGIRAEVLAADVIDFDVAVRAQRAEDGLALYRGELLKGFQLEDAPEFERWLEGERARLRSDAHRLSQELIRADGETDLATSISWARRALEIDPLDESALRRLLQLLEAAGEPGAALDAYDRYVSELADLELSLAPETAVLAHRIRTAADAARLPTVPSSPIDRSRPAVVLETRLEAEAPSETEPIRSEAGSPPAARSRPWWSRRRLVAAAAALLVVASAFVAALRTSSPRPPEDARVLVAAFENRTGDSRYDVLGYVAQDWITQGLQQTQLVNVVDPLSATVAARETNRDSAKLTGAALAAAMAHGAGARVVVWGAIYEQGDSLRFRSHITDVATGRILMTLDPVSSPVTDPTFATQQLRSRIAGAIAALVDRRIVSQTGPTGRPPTFEAYREYVLGLEQYQARRYDRALPYFLSAGRLDTTFVLPLIWAWFARDSQGLQDEADSIVAVLESRRDRLTPLEGYATDFFSAVHNHDLAGKLAALMAGARLSPGSTFSHNAAMFLNLVNRPREALHYTEAVDPEHGWVRRWPAYWGEVSTATHSLGLLRRSRLCDAWVLPLRSGTMCGDH